MCLDDGWCAKDICRHIDYEVIVVTERKRTSGQHDREFLKNALAVLEIVLQQPPTSGSHIDKRLLVWLITDNKPFIIIINQRQHSLTILIILLSRVDKNAKGNINDDTISSQVVDQ